MTLNDFREKNNLTYQMLSDLLGLEKTKVFRICHPEEYQITLKDAMHIQAKTDNVVSLEELCQ